MATLGTSIPRTISDNFVRSWALRFTDAWNSREPGRLLALCTDDVRWEDPFIHPGGAARGKEELRDWLTSVWRAFPDLEFAVVGSPFVSMDRTRIGALWTGVGHQTGPLDPPGFAPTGARVEMQGFDVHTFRGDLLCEVVTSTDTTSVARQIGAAPPPGSSAERAGVRMQHLFARRLRRRGA